MNIQRYGTLVPGIEQSYDVRKPYPSLVYVAPIPVWQNNAADAGVRSVSEGMNRRLQYQSLGLEDQNRREMITYPGLSFQNFTSGVPTGTASRPFWSSITGWFYGRRTSTDEQAAGIAGSPGGIYG